MKLKTLLVCAVLFCSSSYCYAKEIAVSVILSSNLGVYKEVENGFNAFLTEKGVTAHLNEHNLVGQDEKAVSTAVNAENPDIIFAIGEAGLKSATQQKSSIPIVFSMVYNLSAYANQNISGVLIETPVEMRIAGIKKAFPNIKKISMLYSQNSIGEYKDISSECTKQGLTLIAKEVNSEQEFGDALNSVLSGTDCFLMSPDGKIYFSQSIKMLFLESNKRKIPVIGLSSFFTKAGAAMSFDSDYKDLGRQAAELASKIIAGEKITGLKSVRPRKCVYSLNLGTAERIGITFPQNVIKEAAEVFN